MILFCEDHSCFISASNFDRKATRTNNTNYDNTLTNISLHSNCSKTFSAYLE